MQIPLMDAVDNEIIMHRDVHFSKNFSIMLEYYLHDSVGVIEEFPIQRIRELKKIEDNLKQDIAETILSDDQIRRIEKAKSIYIQLKDVYEKTEKNSIAQKISDLILSEEPLPQKEMDALTTKDALDPLLNLVDSLDFYDPLFPGYGRVPEFAAQILAKIQNPRALPHLFYAIEHADFSTEVAFIQAIVSFKEKALEFLFPKIEKKPFTSENKLAVHILTNFPPHPQIAQKTLSLLQREDIYEQTDLAAYLVLACEGLCDEVSRKRFSALKTVLPKDSPLQGDLSLIESSWNN